MQVNLYLPELRPQQTWLSARNAAVLVLVFLLVMAVVQIIWSLRAGNLETEVAQRQRATAETEARFEKLRKDSSGSATGSLDDRIASLKLAITNREKVRRIISGQNVGNAQGFLASMQALARESRDDFALDHFTLSRGGNYVELHGHTRTAKDVPLYLQRLKSDPAFSHARFGLLSISSEAGARQGLEFALGYNNVYLQQPAGAKKP